MKKLILLFTLISGFAFGQKEKYINIKDFEKNGASQLKVDKIIKILDGKNEYVPTKIFIGKSTENKKGVDFFNEMIYKILVKSQLKLKNNSTFRPLEIDIYEKEPNLWLADIKYSGMNDMGGIKESRDFYDFNEDLEIVSESKF